MLETQVLLLFLCIAAVAVGCFFVGRHFHGGLISDHLAGIGRIREIGEYVALRTECRNIGRGLERDHWFCRGRLLLATCEMIIEHRFDLRAMQIRRRPGGVDLVLSGPTMLVSHGEVRVEHMQAGTVLGLPILWIRAGHINRLLARARANMTANQTRADDYLSARARDSVRSFLMSLAAELAPGLSVRVLFADGRDDGGPETGDSRVSPATQDSLVTAARVPDPLPTPAALAAA